MGVHRYASLFRTLTTCTHLPFTGNQLLEADLHDVVVEAFLSGAAAQECDISTFTLEPPGGYIDNTGSNTLLQPCDVTFKYGTYDKMTDIKLDTSDMIFTLSVDMLDVLARLQDRVLGPLSKPSADRPVAAAMTFTKVWRWSWLTMLLECLLWPAC